MSSESAHPERVSLNSEEVMREAKAASVARYGNESHYGLYLLAKAAVAVAESERMAPKNKEAENEKSGAGPSASNESAEPGEPGEPGKPGEPEPIDRTELEGDEQTTTTVAPGVGRKGKARVEVRMVSPRRDAEAEDDGGMATSRKFTPINPGGRRGKAGGPKFSGKSFNPINPGGHRIKAAPPSSSAAQKQADAEETEDEEKTGEVDEEKKGEGEETSAEGSGASVAPPPANAPPANPPPANPPPANNNQEARRHAKTLAAHRKAELIRGPGAGRHSHGSCVKCVRGGHDCIVNANVGEGNVCERCASHKEKCSHQEYADGKWIREHGIPAPTPCTRCTREGTVDQCFQSNTGNDGDKYGTTCSKCLMDGVRNLCSLKKPPKKRKSGKRKERENEEENEEGGTSKRRRN
ncbi:hypothetical protein V8F20_003963 [Naviculisporaceae sp. PSN 640]